MCKLGVDLSEAAIAREDDNALTVAYHENDEQQYKTLVARSVVCLLPIINTEHDGGTI